MNQGMYNPMQAIKDIHRKFSFCFAASSRKNVWENYQLELLYYHLPNMPEEDARRARKTIKRLEDKIVFGLRAAA